jgi:hypothetical protein
MRSITKDETKRGKAGASTILANARKSASAR